MYKNRQNIIVLDLEIQDAIIHPSDWENTDLIKISCCVVYSYLEDRYHVYGPNDIDFLRALMMSSDLVIGFNSNRFDIPVIFSTKARMLPRDIKTYDILAEVWKALGLDPHIFTNDHKGYSLANITRSTLNKHKTGTGANAPFLWKQGNFWKVIDYCINDVALTVELYNHIQETGFVKCGYGRTVATIVLDKEKFDLWNHKVNQI
jgi:DEAD/DEAH box helicase domain-containing protein